MSINYGIDKEDVVYIHSGISLRNKKEVMSFVTTWMDIEIIILSEVSQIEKIKHHMVLLICEL